MILLIIAAAFASALTALYFAAFFNPNRVDMTYRVLTGPDYDPFHEEMIALIDEAVQVPFEQVYATAADGTRLAARLYVRNEKAPVHLEFHGYKGNGIRDFSGGMQLALSLNENVLLVDERAHGLSKGHTIAFGVKERYDVLTWTAWALERFGSDAVLVLEGISMGAATVLMASELPLPENVKGIWADCPYSAPMAILEKVAGDILGKTAAHACAPLIRLSARLFGRFDPASASAAEAVKNAPVPIQIIHGTGDHFVPVEMSRAIAAAAPEKVSLTEVGGAPHGLSFIKDNEKYRKTYMDFRARIF